MDRYCLQCGSFIVANDNELRNAPSGYCSQGCYDVHEAIKQLAYKEASNP